MESLFKLLIVTQIMLMVMQSLGNNVVVADPLDIGVCYGMKGDNLLPAANVIWLYRKYNIGKIRLFDPNANALQALKGSGLQVVLGTLNEDLKSLASSQEFAQTWLSTNVLPYKNDVNFTFISLGNEVIPGDLAGWVAPAMKNMRAVLDANNLNVVKVTTAVSTRILKNTYPPSDSVFTPEANEAMVAILNFLSTQHESPVLMVNVYPYFAYASDPSNINLTYALFEETKTPVFQDVGELNYYNLFDAIVDGLYWAMEKANAPNVALAVSESGWPSAGNGEMTTHDIASTYNRNFMHKILNNSGTPKRPNVHMDGFIFAMFNEDLKTPGTEQNFGLFYNNGTPVYDIFS